MDLFTLDSHPPFLTASSAQPSESRSSSAASSMHSGLMPKALPHAPAGRSRSIYWAMSVTKRSCTFTLQTASQLPTSAHSRLPTLTVLIQQSNVHADRQLPRLRPLHEERALLRTCISPAHRPTSLACKPRRKPQASRRAEKQHRKRRETRNASTEEK